MISMVMGGTVDNNFLVGIGGKNDVGPVCLIQTRKPSDAFLVASIVAASIEIDEITEPKTNVK